MSATCLPAGTRVEIRNEEWIIRRTVTLPHSGSEVHVTGTSELVRGHDAVFLTTLDQIRELKPEDTILVPDRSPGYRRAKLYVDALLKRTPPPDTTLSLGHRGAIDPAPYQIEPTEKVFGLGRFREQGPQLRPRLLIADAVGLGKTIEVGILVTELIKRGRGDRILCLAKKSMLAQFQQELWARFNIPLVRLDSVGIARLRSRIPTNRNPFSCYNRIIISIDTLKETRASTSYRHYLETFKWDIVIIDEAHNCANPGTANNLLAQRVCRHADAVILTTATPHNGRPRSFAELIRLLDPTAIADPDHFSADDIAPYFIRRFKKDIVAQVGEHFRNRQILSLTAQATPAEEAIFARLADLRLLSKRDERFGHDHLLRWVLLKSYLSSPEAATETVLKRVADLRRLAADGRHDHLTDHIGDLTVLHGQLEKQSITDTARYLALLALLRKLSWDASTESPRIILFTESRRTQDALAAALRLKFRASDAVVQIIHGGMSDIDQSRIVDDFGKGGDIPVRMLIATDVASEGVNLHYQCHLLIHYDLPWSLIRLEQRNGRIDRYGQTIDPHIHYLLTISTCPTFQGDQRIIEALIAKEKFVYENTGDAAGVMNFYSIEREEAAIGEAAARGLSPDEALATPRSAESTEANVLEQLLAAAQRLDALAPTPGSQFANSWPSLFPDDLAFLKESWKTIFPDVALDGHPNRPQVDIHAPDDLWYRCGGSIGGRDSIIPGATALPDEALPADRCFVLTTDRQAVMDAITRARVLARATSAVTRGRGRKAVSTKPEPAVVDEVVALSPELRSSWAKTTLLWEQHPVIQWLLDQVLIHFGRCEAPLLHAPHLAPKTAYVLMRGSIPNNNGRETVVDWFAVTFIADSVVPAPEFANVQVISLRDALGALQLDRLGPTTDDIDVSKSIKPWLPACVAAAHKHLSHLRTKRGISMSRSVMARTTRLNAWIQKSRDLILSKQESILPTSPAFHAQAGRLHQERSRFETILNEQLLWLDRTMGTSDTPVLQIAQVVVGPGIVNDRPTVIGAAP